MWADGYVINLCKAERGEVVELGYLQGLTNLAQEDNGEVKFFTRLFPLGSTRNIDATKYGYSRLQLPSREIYVDKNVDLYGVKEETEEAAFAEIYPQYVGTVSSVRTEEKTSEEGRKYTVYYFKDNGMNWNNALRYDVHNLDSSRSIAFSNTNKTADTDVKQQYLEFRSEGAKTFEPSEGLKVTPYAGVKLRHTLEGGYQERNAGDFNLNMNSGSETAVDSIVGLKLDYAGKDGWSASATLEGGPNLSYAKSQRTASLAGAGSQHFNVDDGQNGGGINSLTSVGVKYSSKESSLNLDAYNWKEDGISDKGVMLNFKKTF